jgi:hypothetical protein
MPGFTYRGRGKKIMTVKQDHGRQDATRHSLAGALAALPLALALVFGSSSCTSEVSESGSYEATADKSAAESTSGAVADAGTETPGHDGDAAHDHDHDAGDGHDHDGQDGDDNPGEQAEQGDASKGLELASNTAAAADSHDGHDHAPGEGHAELDKVADVANPDILDLGGGPRIDYVVGLENHHFGKVMEGAVLSHAFALKADGEGELVIKQVKPTCGCTIAKVLVEEDDGTYVPYGFGDTISQGRGIRIGATLHTKNKRGHQKSRINIFSNDPRGTIQLGLEAEVESFFTLNPKHVSFEPMTVGEVQEHVVKINTSKAERIKLDLVPADLPKGMAAELTAIDEDAEGKANRWDLRVTLGPDVNEGSVGHTLALRSDKLIEGADALPNGLQPVYELSVSAVGRITGMISVNPAYIAMGLVRPGQVVSRTVTIESHDTEFSFGEPPITVVGMDGGEWEHAGRFTTIARPVEGKNAVAVEIRLDGMPEDVSGSFRGKVLIEVGHPTKPKVELTMTGVCRGGVVRSTPRAGVESATSKPVGDGGE